MQHLLRCILVEVKLRYPDTLSVTLQSDNASCFAAASHVPFINALNAHAASNTGIYVREWVFTEAQTGKSALDTHFSYVQERLRRHVLDDEGDLLTCRDIFLALTRRGGIAGTSTILVDFRQAPVPKAEVISIPKIRQVHHISFGRRHPVLRLFTGIDENMVDLASTPLPDTLPNTALLMERSESPVGPRWSAFQVAVRQPKGVVLKGPSCHGEKGMAATIIAALDAVPSGVPGGPPAPTTPVRIPAPARRTRQCALGWAQKKNRNNPAPRPETLAQIRSLQREGTGGNRVTPEEAHQRVMWDLKANKDWWQILLLPVSRVQQLMASEWRKSAKEKAAPKPTPPPAPPAADLPALRQTNAEPLPEDEESDLGEEEDEDNSLRDIMALYHAMLGNTDDG